MSARPARPSAATYTAAEVAALLKCSLKHIQRLTAAGTVPGVIRFGRLVRYSREAVDRWLAAGELADAGRPDPAGIGDIAVSLTPRTDRGPAPLTMSGRPAGTGTNSCPTYQTGRPAAASSPVSHHMHPARSSVSTSTTSASPG